MNTATLSSSSASESDEVAPSPQRRHSSVESFFLPRRSVPTPPRPSTSVLPPTLPFRSPISSASTSVSRTTHVHTPSLPKPSPVTTLQRFAHVARSDDDEHVPKHVVDSRMIVTGPSATASSLRAVMIDDSSEIDSSDASDSMSALLPRNPFKSPHAPSVAPTVKTPVMILLAQSKRRNLLLPASAPAAAELSADEEELDLPRAHNQQVADVSARKPVKRPAALSNAVDVRSHSASKRPRLNSAQRESSESEVESESEASDNEFMPKSPPRSISRRTISTDASTVSNVSKMSPQRQAQTTPAKVMTPASSSKPPKPTPTSSIPKTVSVVTQSGRKISQWRLPSFSEDESEDEVLSDKSDDSHRDVRVLPSAVKKSSNAGISSGLAQMRLYEDSDVEGGTSDGDELFEYEWLGPVLRRQEDRVFYKSLLLKRKNLLLTVGDCVLLRPTAPDRLMYACRINHLYCYDQNKKKSRSHDSQPRMAANWYVGAGDAWLTGIQINPPMHDAELFETDHVDENLCETVLEKCVVHDCRKRNKVDWSSVASHQRDAVTGMKQFFCYRKFSPSVGRVTSIAKPPPLSSGQATAKASKPEGSAAPKRSSATTTQKAGKANASGHTGSATLRESTSVVQAEVRLDGDAFDFKYFRNHSTLEKVTTSSRSLSEMKLLPSHVRCEIQKHQRQILEQSFGIDHQASSDRMSEWGFLLAVGNGNVLLEGAGNKRRILTRFKDEFCMNAYVIELFGSSATDSIFADALYDVASLLMSKSSLSCLKHREDLISYVVRFRSSILAEAPTALVTVLFHDIDDAALSLSLHNALGVLASCERVRIVASCSRASQAFIWDAYRMSNFQWLHVDASIFDPVDGSSSFVDAPVRGTRGTSTDPRLAERGVRFVLASLTANQKSLFKLILEHILRTSNSLSFRDLWLQAREEFLVSSENMLRTQLREFMDHRLIAFARGSEGHDTLSVSMSTDAVKELLASWPT